MKKLVLALLLLFLAGQFAGCSKYTPSSGRPGELAGTWNWLKTDGGIANHIHTTPASTGKTIQWKLTADGKYSILENGSLISQGNYTLSMAKSIRDNSEKKVIHFEGSQERDWMILQITQQQMEITDNNYDGVVSIFTRGAVQ